MDNSENLEAGVSLNLKPVTTHCLYLFYKIVFHVACMTLDNKFLLLVTSCTNGIMNASNNDDDLYKRKFKVWCRFFTFNKFIIFTIQNEYLTFHVSTSPQTVR